MYTLLQKSDQKYAAAQEILLQQGSKIEALENRLSASGENANLSVDALKVVLREQDNEIRKLWDLASKRNRADIDANAAKLGNLNTAMNSASGASASDLKALRSKVNELENAVAALPSGLEISIAQNKENIEMLGSSIKSLRSDVANMESSPSSGGSVGYDDLTNMKLEIEDIQIRLDRIQNAMSGG
jgi:alanyl-tRNA synthetase